VLRRRVHRAISELEVVGSDVEQHRDEEPRHVVLVRNQVGDRVLVGVPLRGRFEFPDDQREAVDETDDIGTDRFLLMYAKLIDCGPPICVEILEIDESDVFGFAVFVRVFLSVPEKLRELLVGRDEVLGPKIPLQRVEKPVGLPLVHLLIQRDELLFEDLPVDDIGQITVVLLV